MSWYEKPEVKSERERKYLTSIQKVFMVKDANHNWIPYRLTPHQVDWHLGDVAIQEENAKSRIVVKSRNTSFTTSSIISCLMAVPFFPNQVIPFVRLNQQRANDLINDTKEIIKRMRTFLLEDGSVFPFDPNEVKTDKIGSIMFPNGVEFRAFPATNSSAEVIRGLRIVGNAGIVDEANFIKDFNDIYIALRDASSGAKDGVKKFQINIGTTLKGRSTPFYNWYIKVENMPEIFDIYKWAVFNPNIFNPEISVFEQEGLDPIVPWHTLEDLEKKRTEDKPRFLEEYMCVVVDSTEQFYPYEMIMACINTELKNYKTCNNRNGIFWMGVDVASVNDFFVVTIYEKVDNKFIQRHLHYKRGGTTELDLQTMQDFVDNLILEWKPVRCRIDAQGIGFQMAQALRKKHGIVIDAIRNQKVKGMEKRAGIKLNEFIHTNQKWLLSTNQIELLNDEMQIIHYTMWNYDYKAPISDENGHGDITMASGYGLLPIKYRQSKKLGEVQTNIDAHQIEVLQNAVAPDIEW